MKGHTEVDHANSNYAGRKSNLCQRSDKANDKLNKIFCQKDVLVCKREK